VILFDFEHERAGSLEAAAARLAAAGGRARLLAGGTDLLPAMRVEIVKPERLVSVAGLAPRPPEPLPEGGLRVDALMRLAAIEGDALIGERAPLLATAARSVGGRQIREMGTLGGNLCQDTRCLYLNQRHDFQFGEPCYKRGGECCYPFPGNARDLCWAVHMSDVAPALVALGAELEVLGPDGSHRLAVEALYSGDGMAPLTLAPGELLAAVRCPGLPAAAGWGFRKVARRGGLEFGMAVLAVVLVLEADGERCREARIAAGAIERGPLRAGGAEEYLAGRPLEPAVLEEAAARAAAGIRPLPHHGFAKGELREALRVHLAAVLAEATERARAARRGGAR